MDSQNANSAASRGPDRFGRQIVYESPMFSLQPNRMRQTLWRHIVGENRERNLQAVSDVVGTISV
jgi:hypothetical protein